MRDGRKLAADNAVVYVEETMRPSFAEQRNEQLWQRPCHPVFCVFHLLLLVSGLFFLIRVFLWLFKFVAVNWPASALRRCGLLPQMSHVAWSACVSVCMLVTQVCRTKTAEPIEIPFPGEGADSDEPKTWGRDPHGKGHFGGDVRSIKKHSESLLRCM